MRVLAVFWMFLGTTAAGPASDVPYPNELKEFKFYATYLAPLRPYVSDRETVVAVLGSDQGMDLNKWRILPLFVGEDNKINGRPWAPDVTGRLAEIVIKPKGRVSMRSVAFSPAFTHSMGGVSEVNVVCDVYTDNFGLQYWLYAEDSGTHEKGDLMEIVYGPGSRVEREIIGPS